MFEVAIYKGAIFVGWQWFATYAEALKFADRLEGPNDEIRCEIGKVGD